MRASLPTALTAVVATTVLATVAAGTTVLGAAPARASYPGDPGRLAFGAAYDGGQPDVYSVQPNGRGLLRLTDDPAFDACPAYSPDGNRLAWCSSTGDPAGQTDIWVMRADGHGKRRVTALGGTATFPDFSPDGRRLAFGARPAGTAAADVYTVGVDGAGLVRLTEAPGPDRFPVWSPDGSRIAFLSSRTGTAQVWVMDADGGNQRQLTFDADPKDQVPEWSPDGSQLAYVVDTPGPGLNLWVMDADGGRQRALTAGTVDRIGPAWSPDGSRIAFLEVEGTADRLATIPADGGDERLLPDFGVEYVPAWQPRTDGD